MHIHVFAIDILPSDNVISTGGGLRSLQIIAGLRRSGFEVTYSIPAMTTLATAQWDRLTSSERRNAFSWSRGETPRDILARFKPDAVCCLWPALFTFPAHRAEEGPLIIADINGFQNVEGALAQAATGATISLRIETERYLNKILTSDIILCGSAEQKAYWSGLLSFHTDNYIVRDMISLPYSPPTAPDLIPYTPGAPTFFCTGSFLPWNSPEGHLITCAAALKEAGRGEIHVIGTPDPSMQHANAVNEGFRKLAEHAFVNLTPSMPYAQLSRLINGNGIALDLNAKTLEREFAIPIRTVNYLAHGVPLIANNYSVIGQDVAANDAGWCVDPADSKQLSEVIAQILDAPAADLEAKSENARSLAKKRFSPDPGFAALKDTLVDAHARRAEKRVPPKCERRVPSGADLRPCVLVISDDFENFLELRVRIPFDAMYRNGLIKGYHLLHKGRIVRSVGVQQDIGCIDAVWVQRAPVDSPLAITDMLDGRFVYDIDDNLLLSPSYRPSFSAQWYSMIRALLASAGAITTTSARLTDSLQRHSGHQIEHKTFIAPNLAERSEPTSGSDFPDALLLAASDHLPLTNSLRPFIAAIKKFTKSHNMPLVYVGPSVNNLGSYGLHPHSTGLLSYQTYREYVRQGNFVAIVPLEGAGDNKTNEFIECKSDIKMVEFGSLGVPAVYSDVAPYRETPLTSCGPLADMADERSILNALEKVYSDAGRWREAGRADVETHRLATNVVERTWLPAIESVRMSVPLDLENFRQKVVTFSKLKREIPAPRELFCEADYISRNADAISHIGGDPAAIYRHYVNEGVPSGRTWFPASVANAHELMMRVRQDILDQTASLGQLQSRTTSAIAALAALKEAQSRAATATAEPSSVIPAPSDSAIPIAAPAVKRQARPLFGLGDLLKKRDTTSSPPALFDSEFYLTNNPDVRESGYPPYAHYLRYGIFEGRAPNQYFDMRWYAERYLVSAPADTDPLAHYIEIGAALGHNPGPRFSSADYLEMYPDVSESGLNPLEHYLKIGIKEGRSPRKA